MKKTISLEKFPPRNQSLEVSHIVPVPLVRNLLEEWREAMKVAFRAFLVIKT